MRKNRKKMNRKKMDITDQKISLIFYNNLKYKNL